MAEPFYIKQIRGYNHKKFVQTLQLNQSSKCNLQAVMKIMNYYREVIPVHALASKSIHAKSIIIAEKYKYFKEDRQKLEDLINSMSGISKYLSEKFEKIEEKQNELISRTKCLEPLLKNYNTTLSRAEMQCKDTLESLKKKANDMKSNMDYINSKLKLIAAHNEFYINFKKLFFQEWQIEFVRRNLFCMSDGIRILVEQANSFESLVLDETE